MENQKIFFSYSRVDGSEFALRLATDLKKKGFDVWIDQEDIRAGLDWDIEIEKALRSCDCLLFVETEKSVVSNNVLDEVYYALEQNKKVIPLIYVDSRTPYRLNRLQHIDFSKSYDNGLVQLVNELGGNVPAATYSPKEAPVTAHNKPFYKNYGTLVIIACFIGLITAITMLATKNKGATPTNAKEPIALADTQKIKRTVTDAPNSPAINDDEADKKIKEKTVPVKNKKGELGNKAPAGKTNPNPGSTESTSATGNLNNLDEIAAGDWRLINAKPRVKSQNGYLKFEVLDPGKVSIKSYIQFYYLDSKASSYPTIFNAFVGCAACALSKEMKLHVEDIAVGSRTIKTLQEDQADGKKAGDIISDVSSNKSIRGTAALKFIDDKNAIVEVKVPVATRLTDELVLEPFVYTFQFERYD